MKKLSLFLFSIVALNCFGSSFTPGNIVVVHVGDGVSTLNNAAQPVTLDEYTLAGVLVQSIPLPTSAVGSNHALTLSGSASSEGSLTLSANGQYLVLAGYDAAPALVAVSSDSTVNRTIARIDAAGVVNTSTGILAGTAYKKNNIRGAVSNDGTQFWCAGTGSSNTGGTFYLPFGSVTNAPVQVSTTLTNTRTVNIFNGQLYVSSASSTFYGISSVGTGLPTTNGQTTTILPGFPTATGPSNYSFYFVDMSAAVPGVDVVYITDDRTTAPDGGIYKYSLVGGTWLSNGNITSTVGLRGITAAKSCSAVNIIATADTAIFGLVDASGYNQTITGTLTNLVTTGANKRFKGVSFTPGTALTGLTASVSAVTNINCFGGSNGSITVNVSGATGTTSYNWGGGITTQNRNNVAAGTYVVTVTDQAGCSDTASATITQPPVLTASAAPTNVTCNGGNNGAINVTVAGGTPNYNYNWGGGVTTQNRNNIVAGTYIVTVTDSKSCTATATSIITQPTSISITGAVTNLPCTGGNTGAVNITVSGGNSGFTYSWSNSSNSEDLTGLAAGSYTVTVTDASSCTATSTFILSQSGSLTITPTVTGVACNGGANGAINIAVSGGTPNYTYSWSNSTSNPNLSGLSAGNYSLTVTDNGGCTLINSFTVTEPAVLAATYNITNASCYGGTNGVIDITVNGGTTSYTYNWGGGIVTEDRNNLGVGTYAVTITDAHNCTATASVTVSQPDSLALSLTPVDATSFGANDGSITLVVVGGTSPISSYNWSNSTGTQNISNVAAGNYCVTVTDSHNCTATKCANVGQPSGITETDILESFYAYYTGNTISVRAQLQHDSKSITEIFDIAGRLLQREETNAGNLSIDFSVGSISSSCVFVRISTDGGVALRKVVIAH